MRSSSTLASKELATWLDKLESLSQLEPGWNRHGAAAPSAEAIRVARQFIEVMVKDGQSPTRVAASAVGGVGLTRQVAERMVYVEFYNDGNACALLADDAGEERVLIIERASQNTTFKHLLDEMKAYLDG